MSIALSIGIRHRDCWHYSLSKKLDATIVVKYTYMLPNNQLYGYQTIISPRIGELEAFLKAAPQIRKYAVLSRSADRADVITWAEQGSIIDNIIRKNCVFIGPTVVKDGVENWHIMAPTREELQDVVAAMEQCADIAYIRNSEGSEPDVGLTERQMLTLRTAVEMGYFDTPRRASVRDVAKKLNVSASTAVEHLRKAEKKVLENYARS
ncbi:MAG TPA: helix-turn-helix domain-containing protein [Methanocella sp.]|uniref:helix-turn-helix domain-containing protein n=1 Tax=Methanocella sp. TaxID=2052833 RepID=UPI002C17C303|nr:helix-turn-helix domain-containing protein [Methanocella sp.]HTY90897.1 helix-turn-helix domain-containing protein [Methanocella sp.]